MTAATPAIGPSDVQIFDALSRYSYLSARQVCRLLYSSGSLTYVQTRLKQLTHDGYLQRLYLPRLGRFGSSPSIYRLAARGIKSLRQTGLELGRRYRPSEEVEHSYLFLSHNLAANSVMVGAELLARRHPSIAIGALIHESELKRTPIVVSEGERSAPVIPDGYMDFRLVGAYQTCLALELDQGTVDQKRFRRKVHQYLLASSGPWQQRFDTQSMTVAFLATPGVKRRDELLSWIEAELKDTSVGHADLFRVSGVSPESSSEQLFLAPTWLKPFDARALSLLEPPV